MKITQSEKNILKNIDPKFKYIARDSNGDLNLYETKPIKSVTKGYWDNDTYYQINIFGKLFDFIKWECSFPYRITSLIRGDYCE